jgi:hypothetical protein
VRIATEANSLGSIWYHLMGLDRHVVVFHPILNRPDTPIEIVRFIAKHELAHIVRPGRWSASGHWEGHPPEFWELEYRLAPERWACWHWISDNLRRHARHTRWGFRVFRTWNQLDGQQLRPYTPQLPLRFKRWNYAAPDDGQLRLPPDWAPAPLPLERRIRRD